MLSIGERVPEPLRKIGASAIVQFQQYRGKNHFVSYWNGYQFRFGYFDRLTFRKARNVIKDGKIDHEQIPISQFKLDPTRDAAIDIGAHFGYYTVILAKLNPEIPIHAFEPDDYNMKVLNLNVEKNNLGPSRVQVHKKVVSDLVGTVSFYTDTRPEGTVSHTANPSEKHSDHKRMEMEATSAGTFCSENGIKDPWVKIDAEGKELEILTDLFNQPSVNSVMGFVELHLNRENIDRESYQQLLNRHGYVTTEVKGRAKETNPGFLFSPKNRKYWD